jgi:peroxiredoxin
MDHTTRPGDASSDVQACGMAIAKGRTSKAAETPTLKVGDPAPDFTLTSHAGEQFTLSDKRGTNVVLAFYPLAFTSV